MLPADPPARSRSQRRAPAEVALPQLAERLTELLPLLTRAISRYESNCLSQGAITVPQFWALELLAKDSPCSMTKLAAALHLKCSSATGLVDRLTRHGFVTRSSIPGDRRKVGVSLTPEGARLVHEVYQQKRKGLLELFRPLSAGERRQYLAIIEKLSHALNTPASFAKKEDQRCEH